MKIYLDSRYVQKVVTYESKDNRFSVGLQEGCVGDYKVLARVTEKKSVTIHYDER